MSEQVAIEVIEDSSITVEVVDDNGVEVVEIIHPGPQGPPGVTTVFLSQLQDVDVTDRTNGSVLYFDGDRDMFVANTIETKITLTDGGNF